MSPHSNVISYTTIETGFFDFIFNDHLLTTIQSVVGDEITLSPIQHCRPFLPARNGKQLRLGAASVAPWHQDQAVTREEADESTIYTVWIPLTDVTADTGCLKVIPFAEKRKKTELLEHIKMDCGTTINPEVLPETPRIDCEMGRGDILIMDAFTPHCSQTNTTLKVRWSLDLRFQKTGTPTGRPFWPEFVLKSKADGSTEQRDFDEWCRRWEHDLNSSEGQRWHRVAGDVGGSIGGKATHTLETQASDDPPPTTLLFVNSRTLMGCIDPLRRGVDAPHQCPLESVASYPIYADVRAFR